MASSPWLPLSAKLLGTRFAHVHAVPMALSDLEESKGSMSTVLRSLTRTVKNVLADFRKADYYGTTVYGCYIVLAFTFGAVRAFILAVAVALRGIFLRVLGSASHSPVGRLKAKSGIEQRVRAG